MIHEEISDKLQEHQHVLQKKLDMRHPRISGYHGEPGLVAPHAWKASLSGACPGFSAIPGTAPS